MTDAAQLATHLRIRADWDDEFDPATCNLFEDAADTIADLLSAVREARTALHSLAAQIDAAWPRATLAKLDSLLSEQVES